MADNNRPHHENNFTRSFSPSGAEKPKAEKVKFNNVPYGFWAKERENTPPREEPEPENKA
jgi:hypothetical protein